MRAILNRKRELITYAVPICDGLDPGAEDGELTGDQLGRVLKRVELTAEFEQVAACHAQSSLCLIRSLRESHR